MPGARDLHRTTAALDDAGQRLSKLFLTQLALNASFGIVIGTTLWLIGVPSAPLWGMLAMIMRFVPYIGALISAVFPLVLAAAVGPGWTMVLLFGAEPPLTPQELVYQRMLARDPIEAVDQARAILKEKSLSAYYDEVLLEGLRLARSDVERGLIDDERLARVRDVVADIIDDLSPQAGAVQPDENSEAPRSQLAAAETALDEQELARRFKDSKPVLCIPGGSLLDEAATMVLAHLIQQRGVEAWAEKADSLSNARVMNWETEGIEVICFCYMATATLAQIRYAIRRAQRRLPSATIVVALLGNTDRLDDQEIAASSRIVQQSAREAVDGVLTALIKRSGTSTTASPAAA